MSEGDDMQGDKLLKWVDDDFPSDQEKSFKKSSKKSLKKYSKKSLKKSMKYDSDQEEELRYQQDIQMAKKASMKSVYEAKRMYLDSDDDIDQENDFNTLKAKRPRGNEPSNLLTFSDSDVASNEPSKLLKFSDLDVASGSGITPSSAKSTSKITSKITSSPVVSSPNLDYKSTSSEITSSPVVSSPNLDYKSTSSEITSSPVAPYHESSLEITSSPVVPSLSLNDASTTAITSSPVEYIVLATSNQENKFVSSRSERDRKVKIRKNQQFGRVKLAQKDKLSLKEKMAQVRLCKKVPDPESSPSSPIRPNLNVDKVLSKKLMMNQVHV